MKLNFFKGRCYDTWESNEKKSTNRSLFFITKTEPDDGEEEVARVTYVNNLMHSIFSNVEVYVNNQQIYISNGLYAHESYISNNFREAINEYKGVLNCEGQDYEQAPEDITNPLTDPFFTRRKFTGEIFETVSIATRKPSTNTIKDEQDENIQGKFYQKQLIKVIEQKIRFQ